MITFLIFFLAALVGQIGHWLKKSVRAEIFASYIECIRHKPYTTIRAVSLILFTVIGTIAGGLTTITLQNICIMVMAGYVLDSAFNEFPD